LYIVIKQRHQYTCSTGGRAEEIFIQENKLSHASPRELPVIIIDA